MLTFARQGQNSLFRYILITQWRPMLLIQVNGTLPRPLGPLGAWFGKQWSIVYMWMKEEKICGGDCLGNVT
jgi:hypothetical protein